MSFMVAMPRSAVPSLDMFVPAPVWGREVSTMSPPCIRKQDPQMSISRAFVSASSHSSSVCVPFNLYGLLADFHLLP